MAMMPSAEPSSANLYDSDAVERDLIDPDDGTLPAPASSFHIHIKHAWSTGTHWAH